MASGRYHTADVHARSWITGSMKASFAGPRQQSAKAGPACAACAAQALANGSTPAALHTRVLQRQVGFSSTRT